MQSQWTMIETCRMFWFNKSAQITGVQIVSIVTIFWSLIIFRGNISTDNTVEFLLPSVLMKILSFRKVFNPKLFRKSELMWLRWLPMSNKALTKCFFFSSKSETSTYAVCNKTLFWLLEKLFNVESFWWVCWLFKRERGSKLQILTWCLYHTFYKLNRATKLYNMSSFQTNIA